MDPENDDIYSLNAGDDNVDKPADAVRRLQEEALDALLTGDFDTAYDSYDKILLDANAASKIDKHSLERFYTLDQHVDGKSQRQEAASRLFREHWADQLGEKPALNDHNDEANEPNVVDAEDNDDRTVEPITATIIDWRTSPVAELIGKPAHVSYQAFDLDKFGVIAGHVEEIEHGHVGDAAIALIPCMEDGWPADTYFSLGSVDEHGRLKLDTTYANGATKPVVRSLTVWNHEPNDFHRKMDVTPLDAKELEEFNSDTENYGSFLDLDDEDGSVDTPSNGSAVETPVDDSLSRVDAMIESLGDDPEVKAEIARQARIAMDEWSDDESLPHGLHQTDQEDGMECETLPNGWKANWIAASTTEDGKLDLSALSVVAEGMGAPLAVINAEDCLYKWSPSFNGHIPAGTTIIPSWLVDAMAGNAVLAVIGLDSADSEAQEAARKLIGEGVLRLIDDREIKLPSTVVTFAVAPAERIADLRAAVEKTR